MIVEYFVVQMNEKGERKNKFLFSEERALLFAGMEIKFKKQLFQIQYLQLSAKSITVICYEVKKKIKNGTIRLLDQDIDL